MPFTLEVLGSINSPGTPGKSGDDRFGFNLGDGAAWVFDGATDVSPLKPFPQAESGAAWVAEALSQSFMMQPQGDQTASAYLHAILTDVRKKAEADSKIPLDTLTKDAWPIAAGVWIKAQNEHAEISWLGDCMAIVAHDGAAQLVGTPEKAEDEVKYHAKLVAMSHEDRWEALRIDRLELNTQGRPTFGLNPAAAGDLNSATFVLAPETDILLMTDGFYRLVAPYGLETPESLMQKLRESGLSGAIEQLRGFENGTDDGPARVKSSDDACAVWLRFGKFDNFDDA